MSGILRDRLATFLALICTVWLIQIPLALIAHDWHGLIGALGGAGMSGGWLGERLIRLQLEVDLQGYQSRYYDILTRRGGLR